MIIYIKRKPNPTVTVTGYRIENYRELGSNVGFEAHNRKNNALEFISNGIRIRASALSALMTLQSTSYYSLNSCFAFSYGSLQPTWLGGHRRRFISCLSLWARWNHAQ